MTSVETHRPTPRRPTAPHRSGRRAPEPTTGGPALGHGTPLPSGRAVVGALLMAVAAVGVFAAVRSAGEGPSQPIVVAAVDVPVGHRLAAADLHLQTGLLPEGSGGSGYDTVAAAVGAVTVAPLRAGDVLLRSAVLAPDGSDGDHGSEELSFSVERERALDGELQAGERVDILATYGTGDSASTNVVARDVMLVDTDEGGRSPGIGASTKITFTVALANRDDVLRLAHATQVAAVTLVRASRSGGNAPGALDTFRSPGANPVSPTASPNPASSATASSAPASTAGTSRPSEDGSGG